METPWRNPFPTTTSKTGQNVCLQLTHPVPLEADELEQPHDPGREEGDEEVEGSDAEADAALEVALVVVRRGLPVALVEGVPALAEGLEAGAHLEARLHEGHQRLVLAERQARLKEEVRLGIMEQKCQIVEHL